MAKELMVVLNHRYTFIPNKLVIKHTIILDNFLTKRDIFCESQRQALYICFMALNHFAISLFFINRKKFKKELISKCKMNG